jgi:parvulin-like peptidyl-prolyl isomerase
MMQYPARTLLAKLILASQLLAFSLAHADQQKAPDVVAMVGDQAITFSEINTMMNSSAIVGLSMPALGTPERDTVRITLLDKMISANLLYLDALKKGVDKDPAYQQDIEAFSDAILTSLYRKKILVGNVDVSDEEIQTFYKQSIAPGTEFTDEVRTGIEASIRNRKLKDINSTLRDRLREGVTVSINEKELNPEEDELRADSAVAATYAGTEITWGEVKGALGTPLNAGSMENRVKALDEIIDSRLITSKARNAGLESDPVYLARMNEYRKTSLINYYRHQLIMKMEPSDAEIKDYYAKNRERIAVKEVRKVQMVVLKTREEAEAVKKKIESGEITMYKAAAEYSIVPDARQTLGEIGWVRQGSGFPELDAVTFSLGPDEIGGPVESPAGWHLVRVLDLRDAALLDIEDEKTVEATRRMMIDEKLDEYVVGLRKNDFTVEIYQDTLNRLAQKEVDWYVRKAETDTVPPEKVKEQIEKLMK